MKQGDITHTECSAIGADRVEPPEPVQGVRWGEEGVGHGSSFLQGMDWELLASSVSTQLGTPGTTLDKYFLEFCRTGVSDQETLNHLVFSVTPNAFALEGIIANNW